jgi:integrase
MNAITSVLRGAFNLAWENGEIDTDRPIRCLKRLPNYDRPRAIFLSRAECSALIETSRPDLRQLILAALYTGCRVHELTTLRVRHVAREGYGIYVSPSKNYRPRFVFLPDEGMAFFLAACEGKLEDDLVFVNTDGRQWSDRYKHLFRRVVNEVRLPQETVFHCLRHTYASQLVGAGVPLPVVAKQLGHESTSTVDKIYGHLAPQQAEEEVNRRFTPLSPDFAARAAASRERLHELRSKFRVTDARFYSAISGYSSWPRSNHSHFSGSILFQLRSGSQR